MPANIKINPQYEKIKCDSNALNSLPTNGIPDDLQTIETVAADESNEHESNDSEFDDHELFNKETETSSFLPQNENGQLENDAIQSKIAPEKLNWPTVEDDPLNEYTTPFLATLAFPILFPDGKGDPTNLSLNRDDSFISRIQHLLKFAECTSAKFNFRFASHPRFSYWALNLIQRNRTLQQSSVFLKQNPGEAHLTLEELQNMAKNNTSKSFMTKLSRYVGNITGSLAYWHRVEQDLKTIISYKGAPTIFFTLAEFILETENRLRRETRHKTENSSNVNPGCDEFPVSIYPSNFPGQTDGKVGRETRQRRKSVLNSY